MPQPSDELRTRFWAKVERRGGGCWTWKGARNSTGYGAVSVNKVMHCAHRVAAWLAGMVDSPEAPSSADSPQHVLHRCDNRACCNPDHLFTGTYTDNLRDAYAKSRRYRPKMTREGKDARYKAWLARRAERITS